MTVNSWGCVCTDAVCEVVPLHEHQREVERMRELLLSFATSSWLNDHHKARIQAVLLSKPAVQPDGVVRCPKHGPIIPETHGQWCEEWRNRTTDQQAACTKTDAGLVQPCQHDWNAYAIRRGKVAKAVCSKCGAVRDTTADKS
jgi:hypothetical protein